MSDYDNLLTYICADEDLLAAFRADPCGVARAFGVALTDEVLAAMENLEAGAVTDALLDLR